MQLGFSPQLIGVGGYMSVAGNQQAFDDFYERVHGVMVFPVRRLELEDHALRGNDPVLPIEVIRLSRGHLKLVFERVQYKAALLLINFFPLDRVSPLFRFER